MNEFPERQHYQGLIAVCACFCVCVLRVKQIFVGRGHHSKNQKREGKAKLYLVNTTAGVSGMLFVVALSDLPQKSLQQRTMK